MNEGQWQSREFSGKNGWYDCNSYLFKSSYLVALLIILNWPSLVFNKFAYFMNFNAA